MKREKCRIIKAPGIGQAGRSIRKLGTRRDKHLPRLTPALPLLPGPVPPPSGLPRLWSSHCKGPRAGSDVQLWSLREVTGAEPQGPYQSPDPLTSAVASCGICISFIVNWSLQDLLSAEPGWEEALGPAPEGGTPWTRPLLPPGARCRQTSTCVWRWTLSCGAAGHSTSTLQRWNAKAPVLSQRSPPSPPTWDKSRWENRGTSVLILQLTKAP